MSEQTLWDVSLKFRSSFLQYRAKQLGADSHPKSFSETAARTPNANGCDSFKSYSVGDVRCVVVGRWIASQQVSSDRSCTRGMIHIRILLISPGCSRPNIVLHCRIVASNTFIHSVIYVLFYWVCNLFLSRPTD